MRVDIDQHPCFNEKVRHETARVHLPVAPRCNVQCGFCNRKYDCVNESRPGVTSSVLTPHQAIHYLEQVKVKVPKLTVVGIAGPGDPFANGVETMKTLSLVREKFPEMLLCVASNGLEILPHIPELAKLETSHVTLTINTIRPETAGKIYQWIRYNKKVLRGEEAGRALVENQLMAIKKLKEHGIMVKVNFVLLPGINDTEAHEVVDMVKSLGADMFNIMPYKPTKGSAFEDLEEPSKVLVENLMNSAAEKIVVMRHCSRCRADAVGIIGEENGAEIADLLKESSMLPIIPNQDRPYVAVATEEGIFVNLHLGEAPEFEIYKYDEEKKRPIKVGTRKAPPEGGGVNRWKELGETLHDVDVVFVSGAGKTPESVLRSTGVEVKLVEGLIAEILLAWFTKKDVKALARKSEMKCGATCGGDKQGCGCN